MSRITANGIEIEYDTFGLRGDPPLLLVMGLGSQMIVWDVEFCALLAARGHYVIRFDNRDVGLSTRFGRSGTPNIPEMMARSQRGDIVEVPYLLSDMAGDAAALLEALELSGAHVVGVSMGGMIAQSLAIHFPKRVLSLTSIMSTTGNPELPAGKPDAIQRLMVPPPSEREAAIDYALDTMRLIASSGFPFDEDRRRRSAARCYDRGVYPEGATRQLAAILASGSRLDALTRLRLPALVIHGKEDPLVPVEGGLDTHRAIKGSELLLIEGMGHDLPVGAWPAIVDVVSELAERA